MNRTTTLLMLSALIIVTAFGINAFSPQNQADAETTRVNNAYQAQQNAIKSQYDQARANVMASVQAELDRREALHQQDLKEQLDTQKLQADYAAQIAEIQNNRTRNDLGTLALAAVIVIGALALLRIVQALSIGLELRARTQRDAGGNLVIVNQDYTHDTRLSTAPHTIAARLSWLERMAMLIELLAQRAKQTEKDPWSVTVNHWRTATAPQILTSGGPTEPVSERGILEVIRGAQFQAIAMTAAESNASVRSAANKGVANLLRQPPMTTVIQELHDANKVAILRDFTMSGEE
jgi:hypothetical protein